jgi:lipid-A-disaccharide synthase
MESSTESAIRIFLSAGEASGDLHGSKLVEALKRLVPGARFTCLGGSLLREQGARVVVDNRDLAVVGGAEVLAHLRAIQGAFRKIRTHLRNERPDVVILIDFPDFNILLARYARRLGIKIFYYISPQVWAWRPRRVHTLKKLVDAMAVILPFEPDFYARYGMRVHYVGHPLLDALQNAPTPEEARSRYRTGGEGTLVGLLPGSRLGEIRSLLDVMLEGAQLIRQRLPGVSFILPVAATVERREIEARAERCHLPIRLVSADTYRVMRACDLLIVASGTVTLEAAILGTPMLVIYRVAPLTYRVGQFLVHAKFMGLPNLISDRRISPELLQYEASGERIAREALLLLENPERLRKQREEFATLRAGLGEPGVSERVARMVLEVCSSAEKRQAAPPWVIGGVDEASKGLRHPLRAEPVACHGPATDGPAGSRNATLPPVAKEGRGRCFSNPCVEFLYDGALGLAYPALWLYYLLRSRTDGKYRSSVSQRMGLELPAPPPHSCRVWFHALSLGETLSVLPLVRALKELAPAVEVVFSTSTETGQKIAKKRLSGWVQNFFYLPHDFAWSQVALVRRLKPDLFVLVETDIWPNLLRALTRRGVPAVLVNGRISTRSFARLKHLKKVLGPILHSFAHIFAQSSEDRSRYLALGASIEGVSAAGNLKYDSSPARVAPMELDRLRVSAGVDRARPVWIAGSTHAGEDEVLLEIHRDLLRLHPGLLLILAPRQVQRKDEVASLCAGACLSLALRSRADPAAGRDVYLLDTIGELSRFYALADVAFIGGSLVPFGGHNPLEPIAQGKPTVWGPHLSNFREIEEDLVGAGCGRKVSGKEELYRTLAQWLGEPGIREEAQEAALEFIENQSGLSRTIASYLLEVLHEGGGPVALARGLHKLSSH